MPQIFTGAFLLKSLLELEVVYSGPFKCYKVFSLKMKKASLKRCEPPHLKNNKIFSHNEKYKKDIEKERWGMKNEKYKKSLTA